MSAIAIRPEHPTHAWPAQPVLKVIAKMPLQALILLTLEHKENLRTADAIHKYRVGLGGEPCVKFLVNQLFFITHRE
jgi:hypothetical protein